MNDLLYGENDPNLYSTSDSVAVFRSKDGTTLFNIPVLIHKETEQCFIRYADKFALVTEAMENFLRYEKVSPKQQLEDIEAQRESSRTKWHKQPNSASRYVKMASEMHRRTMESTLGAKK